MPFRQAGLPASQTALDSIVNEDPLFVIRALLPSPLPTLPRSAGASEDLYHEKNKEKALRFQDPYGISSCLRIPVLPLPETDIRIRPLEI